MSIRCRLGSTFETHFHPQIRSFLLNKSLQKIHSFQTTIFTDFPPKFHWFFTYLSMKLLIRKQPKKWGDFNNQNFENQLIFLRCVKTEIPDFIAPVESKRIFSGHRLHQKTFNTSKKLGDFRSKTYTKKHRKSMKNQAKIPLAF